MNGMNGTADQVALLAAALAGVQAELPEVGKNRTADVASKTGGKLYSYTYADLADVSAAIMPLLGKNGLAFAAFPGHQDGRFGLRYHLLHAGGGSIDGFFGLDDGGGMQLIGGRITYARRYCLCAVTGVTADEDVDAREDSHTRGSTARRQQPAGDDRQGQPVQRKPPRSSVPPAGTAGDRPALPGEVDHDSPGTATSGRGGQLTAIWTILGTVYHFGPDEKDSARGVCAQVLGVQLASSTDLSYNQARRVLDTLTRWETEADEQGEEPRGYLMLMLQELAKRREEAGGE